MTSVIASNFQRLGWAIAGLICLSWVACSTTLGGGKESKVNFQIVADKLVYSPGSSINVKFILTNTGETPLYVPRSLSVCSNIEGFFFFQILDQGDHNLIGKGCSSDVAPTWETHVMQQIVDQKFWIALEPGEIFGKTFTIELPRKKGTYRLKAELTPPGFSDVQKQSLQQQQIRVLRSACPAPILRVIVR